MSELKVSISGIRGIWADSLNLQNILNYTKAFAGYIAKIGGKRVLLGRDARPTGHLIANYVASILNAYGIDVIDADIIPTPTVLLGVRKLNFDGGIIITASHNPVEWNALKFVKKGGIFFGEKELKSILSFVQKNIKEKPYSKVGSYLKDNSIEELHIKTILENIPFKTIQKKRFKVILDPINSAGSKITEKLLKKLGCSVFMVNGEMNGRFKRGAEPTPANLKHLPSLIKKLKADVAFAQDPDADRLVIADEKGNVLSEELTLALAIDYVLSKKNGNVVINLSTSSLCEWIANRYNSKCIRTKVGEANVVEGIIRHRATIGGEGNGGVIYPGINCARDSLAGIALILSLLAERNKTVSEIVKDYPVFTIRKEKMEFKGDLSTKLKEIEKCFPAKIDERDGLRLEWEEKGKKIWLHIRTSNTEPVIRIIGESEDEKILKNSIEEIKKIIRG